MPPFSPRFSVSLPVSWSENETGFEQELERVQAQLDALIRERFLGRLISVWPRDCEQVRFYWGKSQTGIQYVMCDVYFPSAFYATSPQPLIPSQDHDHQYRVQMKARKNVYTQQYIAPFEKQLRRATGEEGVTMEMLNTLLGIDPQKNADRSLWFSSPEALVGRFQEWLDQGNVGNFRRAAWLDHSLPSSAASSPSPRF